MDTLASPTTASRVSAIAPIPRRATASFRSRTSQNLLPAVMCCRPSDRKSRLGGATKAPSEGHASVGLDDAPHSCTPLGSTRPVAHGPPDRDRCREDRPSRRQVQVPSDCLRLALWLNLVLHHFAYCANTLLHVVLGGRMATT